MWKYFLFDTRHRLTCYMTRNEIRREKSARRMLEVGSSLALAGFPGPRWLYLAYWAWAWVLHYLFVPVRQLRGW